MQNTLYLASGSPRRWQLLQELGLNLIKVSAEIDETPFADEPAQRYVLRMAQQKNQWALQVLGKTPEFPLLTADTTVALQQQIIGKPESEQDAAAILKRLSGSTHQVLTAVCVHWQGQTHSVLQTNEVTFSRLSDEQIWAYIATGEPMDKAGAFAIQGFGSLFVRHISGSFSGIMGLPIYETGELLINKCGLTNPLLAAQHAR
ncbi:septum formation inhibitor Maf [Testudinibacter sp. TR-2022]|nr:Maf family protein [Testudinibacter sp. TR-2022]TNH05323.1 septum formation inhibitor Maf [Pasteurellaceae bacterium Phil31]TNH08224.1 septum formation inhibitor Maf [Testudinibacter sp. TR-2022]TNH11310.1 septum formation inhibitor Maf [Testudinibacter sp. TR-2022]TNH14335.1 septum formation inhibitor Maf [Testudinibacter sp. TR-2022]TNH20452.1 septum formation inhibitor Maf [Testudinibacter sp. TR-2022]